MMEIEHLIRYTPCAVGLMEIEHLIRYTPCAVGLMEIENIIRSTERDVGLMEMKNINRYAPFAVGLKPSARQGKARLRGLYRIIYESTAQRGCHRSDAAFAGVIP
jgi:hypothetical protein